MILGCVKLIINDISIIPVFCYFPLEVLGIEPSALIILSVALICLTVPHCRVIDCVFSVFALRP